MAQDFIFQIKVRADSGTAAAFHPVTLDLFMLDKYSALLNRSLSEFKNRMPRISILSLSQKLLIKLMYLS